jgi:galactokinase
VTREQPPAADGNRATVRAPGRVNLIGEHTDYNEGLVLPVAIDLAVRIEVAWRDDATVRLERSDDGATASFELDALPSPGNGWHDYVAGTAWSMHEAGLPTRGFDGRIASDLPIGAGLSSSAALELAAAWALSGPDGPARPPLAMARLAQRAENEHVGVRCGLMDQFASACGVEGHALLLDCRSLEWRPVPLPADLALVIAHSGVPRSLGTSAYNERRADCERAVAVAATHDPGVTALRDVDLAMLEAIRREVGPRVYDRAHHVVTEEARVAEAILALEAGDHAALGELFAASHASLRDRFEVSCPELDALVDIAVTTPGVVASRMTGAGFGGCTISLVRPDAGAALQARVEAEYPGRTGRIARTWVVSASAGASFAA